MKNAMQTQAQKKKREKLLNKSERGPFLSQFPVTSTEADELQSC